MKKWCLQQQLQLPLIFSKQYKWIKINASNQFSDVNVSLQNLQQRVNQLERSLAPYTLPPALSVPYSTTQYNKAPIPTNSGWYLFYHSMATLVIYNIALFYFFFLFSFFLFFFFFLLSFFLFFFFLSFFSLSLYFYISIFSFVLLFVSLFLFLEWQYCHSSPEVFKRGHSREW